MKLLLDTHVFLWLAGAPEKLTERALEACKNRRNPIYLSVVSAWEIQVKSQLGKLTLDEPLSELVREQQAVAPPELQRTLREAHRYMPY